MDRTVEGRGRGDEGVGAGEGVCHGGDERRADTVGTDTVSILVTWRACWASPSHVAVTHGPDAGWLLALDRTVTVGRHGCALAIADPALDHHHLTIRRDGDGSLHVRDERTTNGTVLVRAPRHHGARRRRERRLERALGRGDGSARAALAALTRAAGSGTTVTHRWRSLAVGDELLAGATRLQVRAGPAHGGVAVGRRGGAGDDGRGRGGAGGGVPGSVHGGGHGTRRSGGRGVGPLGRARSRRDGRSEHGDDGSRLGESRGRWPRLAERHGLVRRRVHVERHGRRERGGRRKQGGLRERGGGPPRIVLVLTALPAIAMLGLMAGGGTSPVLRWVVLGGVGLSVLVTLVLGSRSARRPAARGGRSRSAPGGRTPVSGATDPSALALRAAGLGRLDERWLPVVDERPGAGSAGGSAVDLDGGTALGAAEGCRDPDAVEHTDGAKVGTGRLTVSPAGLAITGEGADGVARWVRTQLEVAGRVEVPVLVATTSDVVPPGPWAVLDAAGRSGVAPSWQRAVRAALTPVAAPSELTDLLGRPTAQGIASAWTSGGPWTGTLRVPLGLDAAGEPRDVDLVAGGPHALIAGTTGSGKSELLAAWVLAMALRHPPRRLQLLLVDYKGGSTFAAAARLPHTVGLLTDLDAAASDRALATLRAELRRREHLVTAAGVRGIDELAEPPARLVVVVDELRALVEDSPDRLGDLVRLATQGRSLGVHLILATQRPSGVVNAQLRANVNLRLSLRVLDPSDSVDVIGSAVAAHLPSDPGVGFVQSDGTPVRFRVAWLPGDAARDLVDQARRAADRVRRARRADLLRVHRPWLPELPSRITRGELRGLDRGDDPDASTRTAETDGPRRTGVLDERADDGDGGEGGEGASGAAGVAVGHGHLRGRRGDVRSASVPTELTAVVVVDEPDRQRRSLWSWRDGTVLVSGEPRSGRTTALQTLAAVEAASGRGCHVVSRTGWSATPSPGTTGATRGAPPSGTTVATDDPRRVVRLLTLLAQGADPGASLLVDDLEQVVDAVDEASGPGSGQELMAALLRSRGVARVALATTAPHRWAPFASYHLALRVRDVGAAGLIGVPRSFVRAGAPPGRGVLLGGERAVEVQVVLDDGSPVGAAAAPSGSGSGSESGATPTRLVLAPLPDLVRLDDLLDDATGVHPDVGGDGRIDGTSGGAGGGSEADPGAGADAGAGTSAVSRRDGRGTEPWAPLLGVGGDDAGIVTAPLVPGRAWLVCGPAGSGRTWVLRLIAAQCDRPVVLVSPDSPLDGVPPGDALVLVDDAEMLDGATADTLVDLIATRRAVVATSATATQTAYRGVVASVAQARTVVALGGALPPHCAHARAARDPRGGVGRGVLVTGTRVVPIQVAHGRARPASRATPPPPPRPPPPR